MWSRILRRGVSFLTGNVEVRRCSIFGLTALSLVHTSFSSFPSHCELEKDIPTNKPVIIINKDADKPKGLLLKEEGEGEEGGNSAIIDEGNEIILWYDGRGGGRRGSGTVSIKELQMLLHESITSSALMSLKDSHQIANDFAKILVLDILSHQESTSNLGILLSSLFKYESVRLPTRNLIYWSLFLPPTISTLSELSIVQTNYWLARDQEGAKWTKSLLFQFLLPYLNNPDTVANTVSPLTVTVTELPSVQLALQKVVEDALPYLNVKLQLK